MEQYVKPVWQPGDLLSSSEKIIGLCQKRVVYKKDMKVGRLARFLSRFASHSSAGIGVDSPYKMQFAINERGALFVLWAAFCAGVAKLFGKRGVFYEMVGQEVSGLVRDNPAGQSRELTPFILIREVKEERAPEEAQA